MRIFPALFLAFLLSSAAAFAGPPEDSTPADNTTVVKNADGSVISIEGGGNTTITINSSTLSGTTIIGGSKPVTGEGPAQVEDRKTEAYTRIKLEAPVDMIYTGVAKESAPRSLSVSAPANILPLVTTVVEDGRLVVKITGSVILHEPVRITAAGPSPSDIALTGAGSFQATGLKGANMRLVVSGSGSATVAGKIDRVEAVVSGSGGVDTTAVAAKEAAVTVSGSGSVQAFASGTAEVSVSGSGSVHITGNPAKRSVDKTGSGSVSVE